MNDAVLAKREVHAGGRPVKFPSVEALDKAIAAYLETAEWPTITGLAVALDTNRQTLLNYKDKPEFFDSIKKALEFCEAFVETMGMQGKANATMAIFTLKNNYGWKDVSQVEQTMEVSSKPSEAIASDFSAYVKNKTEAIPGEIVPADPKTAQNN